jgi:leader peptidase (prepilin peptidase)/N-methyltransferase
VLLTFAIAGFLLGLLFGSFLNVCIVRIPLGESILKPPSHCLVCGHAIRWFDNIPILSWVLLLGRCRDCKSQIPWRYPAVELAVGIWGWVVGSDLWNACYAPLQIVAAGATDARTELGILTVGTAILGFLLIGLIVMDWQTYRLPDAFTLTGIGLGFLMVCVQTVFLGPHEDDIILNTTHQLRLSSPGSASGTGGIFLTGAENLIFGRLAAVAAIALILLAVRWAYRLFRHREGMGLGDVKMLAMIAAFLGFWPALLTLFLGVVFASIYAISLMVQGKAYSQTRLPLGSFLGIAGLFAALGGNQLIGWYRSLL